MKSSMYRRVARSVLMDEGYDVRLKPGQGYLPGSRVILAKAGEKKEAAIKASQQRALSFTRKSNTRWRTLDSVDLVIAIVPAEKNQDEAEVFIFDSKALVRIFNRAWKALESAKRPVRIQHAGICSD